MSRVILHSDLNNFYASCECLLHPEHKGKPLVVCGRIEDRHGIVLAKNQLAKNAGVKTGMTIYECKKLLPDIITVLPNHKLYEEYSKKVKKIYLDYTDKVESFGIDEAWLDVSDCIKMFGSGESIAEEIRIRVKEEIGLTVSIGVSFNKVFAKLGSDMKKPDAITIITKDNYKELVWKLPVEELLFVGRATKEKLNNLGVKTIGHLANFSLPILKSKFGKVGEKLWGYANGLDLERVRNISEEEEIKSVGNSITFYRDIYNIEDIEMLFYYLSESVSERMKSAGLNFAKTLHISVIDKSLGHYSHQTSLPYPTSCSKDFAECATKLFKEKINLGMGIRGVGVSVGNFIDSEQLLIGDAQQCKEKNLAIDKTMEELRHRFGDGAISRAIILKDRRLSERKIVPCSLGHSELLEGLITHGDDIII